MQPETTLMLDLDERNLAHFLSGLALAALAQRVEGSAIESRRCCWPERGCFAIETEHSCEQFRSQLFTKAHEFLTTLNWHQGFGGVEQGIIASGDELGVNPFVPLGGDSDERPLMRTFSAKVVPSKVLPHQIAELRSPAECSQWLSQIAVGHERRVRGGVSSWGYDCKVNMHASDAGISSDAEGTGHLDPIYPAIELLSLTGASFFAAANAWTRERTTLDVTAWTDPVPLMMASAAASGLVHGIAGCKLRFAPRGAAHGKGASFRFFPPATLQEPMP